LFDVLIEGEKEAPGRGGYGDATDIQAS
jgi:hypothetical protein